MTTDLRGQFVEAMSRAATYVAVLTTEGPTGRYGVTVSSLTSVSADGDRPSLLACLHHLSPAAEAIMKNRAFCVNLLQEDQQAVANLFAGRTVAGVHQNRFDRVEWQPSASGQPIITGATASFECQLATATLWETHYILVGKVVAVVLSDDPAALLYGKRSYQRAVDLVDKTYHVNNNSGSSDAGLAKPESKGPK